MGEAVLQLRDIIGDGSEAFETQSWFPLTLSAWEAEQASHEIQGRVLLRIDYVPIQGTLGSAGFVISGALKKKKNLEGSNIFQKRVYSFSGNEVAYSASMSDIGSSKKMHTPSFQLSALRSVEIPSLHPHLKDLGAGFDLVFLDRAFQFTHDGCVHARARVCVCVCVHGSVCSNLSLLLCIRYLSLTTHPTHTHFLFCIFFSYVLVKTHSTLDSQIFVHTLQTMLRKRAKPVLKDSSGEDIFIARCQNCEGLVGMRRLQVRSKKQIKCGKCHAFVPTMAAMPQADFQAQLLHDDDGAEFASAPGDEKEE
jgi:hypothetical protein